MPAKRPVALLVISCALFLLAGSAAAAQESPGALARHSARAWREGHEAGILRELAALLSLPNVASSLPDTRVNAQALQRMLRARGVSPRLLEVDGAPPAVYGELASPGATRTVVLYAHYDGQPVNPRQWTGAPFTPQLRDQALYRGGREIPFPTAGQRVDGEARIYARSASDDKGTIVAMLTALDALRDAKRAPSVNLKFFFEGEEEAGSDHLRPILEKYRELLRADAWLFCDGPVHQSGAQQVVFGLRGVTDLELTVFGPTRPLHSGHYGNWAPNPGMLLANLVSSMRDDDGHIKVDGYYDDVRPLTAAERAAIAGLPPVDSALRASLGLAQSEANNALLAERIMLPALNLRGLQVGGVQELSANVISTEAHASFDLRLVPNQTPERVRQLVEAHVRSQGYHLVADTPSVAERQAHAKIARLRWAGGYPAQRASMDDPFARAVATSLTAGADRPPLLVPSLGGSGPSYLFTQILGVPVITLPIANYDNNQHAANENLRLQNLWDGIEAYAGMLVRLGLELP